MNIFKIIATGSLFLTIHNSAFSYNTSSKVNVNQNGLQLSQAAASTFPGYHREKKSVHKIFPKGCEVSGYAFMGANLVVNNSGQQQYYLIHNFSSNTIEMERLVSKEEFMSPPLMAKLNPSNWGAFSSDIKSLNFQCFYVNDEGSERVNCQEVIEVCQYPRVKFALSNMGNYWVSTNKDVRQIIKDSTAKGIYLRW